MTQQKIYELGIDDLIVTNTTKGSQPYPSMTTTQKNAIVSPVTGQGVFDTTLAAISIYNGSAWVPASQFNAISPMTTGGDLIYGGASGVATRLANGSVGNVLTSAGGTSAPTWSAPAVAPVSFSQVDNLSFVASVATNALTITIKDAAGNTPSSATTAVSFRSSTLTSGAFVTRTITSALSMTVSSGSTLGHANGISKNIWLYLIDNAGTVEVAVSSTQFDDTFLYSTVAEGGAGAADSESVLYSTTARTSVAIRLI
jgi:hypothetical protein